MMVVVDALCVSAVVVGKGHRPNASSTGAEKQQQEGLLC